MTDQKKEFNPNDIHHRVDIQDLKIDNINESIQHMSRAVDKLTESVGVISEAVVRLAAHQEALQAVSEETKENTDRYYELKGSTDVLMEQIKAIPKLSEDLSEIKTRQTQNNVVIGAITAFATMVVGGAVTFLYKHFGS